MKNKLMSVIKSNRVLYLFGVTLNNFFLDFQVFINLKQEMKSVEKKIYFIGVPKHTNLGDLAQYYCISKWIHQNYPNRKIVEVTNYAIAKSYFPICKVLLKSYREDDLIVFQSGYQTTDNSLGDVVHKQIFRLLPDAYVLMLPQTVFLQQCR